MNDAAIAGLGPARGQGRSIARILCAVGEDRHCDEAAGFAALLAKTCGAELRLFQAVEPEDAEPPDLSHAERTLDRLASRLRSLHGRVRVSTAITVGHAEEEIARHARLMGADLVIVTLDRDDPEGAGRVERLARDAGTEVLTPLPFYRSSG